VPSALESLRSLSVLVADSGDLDAIGRLRPDEATTNPSLILAAARERRYWPIVERALAGKAAEDADELVERLAVSFGVEILGRIRGRVSTEVSPRHSFDAARTMAQARRIVARYARAGFGPDRVLVKVAATWEGIRAAERLEREGICCNMTLVFSLVQAVACAEAGVTVISPFVGRIWDWHCRARGVSDIPIAEDPGVASVVRIYEWCKRHGSPTRVMAASFRKVEQVLALAGCDLLTVSPELLDKLAALPGPVERRLSPPPPQSGVALAPPLAEPEFRWRLNEDAMASDKLAEGIRRFDADARKLAELAAELAAARRAA